MFARRIRRPVTILAAAGIVAGLVPCAAASAASGGSGSTYTNPVSAGYSIDFPDPSVMKGKDGNWYAYATGGPYDETGASDPIKMARSADLTHWQKLGAVFTDATAPTWSVPSAGFWAPDIRYLNGHYLLYFVSPNTTTSADTFDPAIGVATAPTPAGPWTDSGKPLLAPETNANGVGYTTVIDPTEFTDTDGSRYLYYGSYGTGIRVIRLAADGMHTVGAARQVTSTRFEGSYVIRRGGWYYLMASSANCCAGATTGYTVFAGRARSPLGPFRDKEGVSLLGSDTGGTIVVAPNGNRWVGTGHNAIVTDVSGQTFLAYHAVDKNRPYLDGSPGFTMRPMLLDRLDWIDSWPTVRGGAWASDSPQVAPVTRGTVDDTFTAGTDLRAATGSLDVRPADPGSDAGGYGRLGGPTSFAVSDAALPADVHVEADVRSTGDTGSVGVVARYRDPADNIRTVLDAADRTLRVVSTVHGRSVGRDVRLPTDFVSSAWHTVAVDVRGRQISAQISDARLGDPYAAVTATAPAIPGGTRAGVTGAGVADVDNVAAAALYRPHTQTAPPPRIGPLDPAASDDFRAGLGTGWSWLRPDPNAQVSGGQLTWPTEDSDLSGAGADQAGVLLRDPPTGDYTVETKLSMNLGVDTVRNYQQAGLVVYLADDHFLRLDHVAVDGTRIVEFGKRETFDGVSSWGGAVIGPPADTVWLRIAHRTDPATGEGLYRAGSSRDGRHWIWGAVWTLPAGSQPRIGLVSQGSSPATDQAVGKAIARFDYFRVYR